MNPHNLVTCHIHDQKNITPKAVCDRGFEVGTPKFSQWALENQKFQFKVYRTISQYCLCYTITCHLRRNSQKDTALNQSWYASKSIQGIIKTHGLGKTHELTTAKLIEAVQFLCPHPDASSAVISTESQPEEERDERQKLGEPGYKKIVAELEELKEQLEQFTLENNQLKLENNQLFHQQLLMAEGHKKMENERLQLQQEFDKTLNKILVEGNQYQHQLEVIKSVVSELGDKLDQVNLKTNPRWYYASRYYQLLQEILAQHALGD